MIMTTSMSRTNMKTMRKKAATSTNGRDGAPRDGDVDSDEDEIAVGHIRRSRCKRVRLCAHG